MLLEVHNLTRRHGLGDAAVTALRDTSFEVAEGEFVAIMGASGSGKSTLMNIIGLLDRPTSGSLVLAGEPVTTLGHDRLAALRNRRIGFVFQSYNLLARNTTLENVEMPLVYSGLRRSQRRVRAKAALETVELSHRSQHWPGQLSGGEQQRVAIARALIGDPALILADEPTGALDSRTGLSILALFQMLNRSGRTIIMVTHDEQVARHARRILQLQDGRLIGDDSVPTDARYALEGEKALSGWVQSDRIRMMLWESFGIALRSLLGNKMRSFLTTLGIIIGVASVITMVAVGAGAQTQVADQIRSLGANVVMVVPGTARQGAVRMESGSRHTLTEGDAAAIASQIPQVQVAAPSIRASAQIVRGGKNWNTVVNGTTADYFLVREWGLSAGRNFSKGEEEGSGKVALIGTTVARQLFGTANSIGEQIRISSVPFEVVGMLTEKGPSGSGQNQDDIIFVPLSTAKLRLMGSASEVNREAVAYILVKAVSDEAMAAATGAIEALLRQRHRLATDRENDFQLNNPAAAMAAQRASTTTIAWLLAAIASVSLVVGGISIMNIMLVSVTERTREIGLRLAVGARRRDIRNQFLTEAISLCLVGGVMGIALGALASWAVARLAGWPIFLGLDAVLFAVGFATSIGVFFGYYPAQKAAKLEPVVALRSE